MCPCSPTRKKCICFQTKEGHQKYYQNNKYSQVYCGINENTYLCTSRKRKAKLYTDKYGVNQQSSATSLTCTTNMFTDIQTYRNIPNFQLMWFNLQTCTCWSLTCKVKTTSHLKQFHDFKYVVVILSICDFEYFYSCIYDHFRDFDPHPSAGLFTANECRNF